MKIDQKMVVRFRDKRDAIDGLLAAFRTLDGDAAARLSDEQKTVLLLAVECGHRNDTDTWDHEFIRNDAVSEAVADLLEA